jgi:hypothetical protein
MSSQGDFMCPRCLHDRKRPEAVAGELLFDYREKRGKRGRVTFEENHYHCLSSVCLEWETPDTSYRRTAVGLLADIGPAVEILERELTKGGQ